MTDNVEVERHFEGIFIDHKLCWKQHINHVKTKMLKSLLYCTEQKSESRRSQLSWSIEHTLGNLLLKLTTFTINSVWTAT